MGEVAAGGASHLVQLGSTFEEKFVIEDEVDRRAELCDLFQLLLKMKTKFKFLD